MPVHVLDVANATSPYVYYKDLNMIAHDGRLYAIFSESDFHRFRQYVAVEPPWWAWPMSICLRAAPHYAIASELTEYFNGFTAKSHLMMRLRRALRTIQRFWRRKLNRCAPLFVDALSSRPQTWLQGVPEDVLRQIQTLVNT